MKKTKKETISEEKYTKSQIVNSKIYISNRDLLNAVLRENKKYTKIEIDEIIKNYIQMARHSENKNVWQYAILINCMYIYSHSHSHKM